MSGTTTSQIANLGIWQAAPYSGPLANGTAVSSLGNGTYVTSIAPAGLSGISVLSGAGYGRETDADYFSVGLLDCPRETLPPPTLLFPVPLDQSVPQVRFHLQVWRATSEKPAQEFWSTLYLGGTCRSGYLTFRTAAARREFVSWWKRYCRRFFDDAQPVQCFLPWIRPGPLRGCFVGHKSGCDGIEPHNFDERNATRGLALALNEITAPWAWIASNTKGRVLKVPGGWLFARASEAGLFTLHAPWSSPSA